MATIHPLWDAWQPRFEKMGQLVQSAIAGVPYGCAVVAPASAIRAHTGCQRTTVASLRTLVSRTRKAGYIRGNAKVSVIELAGKPALLITKAKSAPSRKAA